MALFIPTGLSNGVLDQRIMPGNVMGGAESLAPGAITTVGAGTWTGAAIATGIITRTGPVGGYTDTTDTSTNILNALAGNAPSPDGMVGSTFRMLFINGVAQALTFAAGVGVKSGAGTLTVAASLWREYLWTILNASAPQTLNCNTTNASAAVTFNLPPGTSAFLLGPDPRAVNITPGMTVSGTGITAGTTVLGLTYGQGGITGVTLSANATATSAGGVALTFLPTLQIDSLRSGTA